MKILLKKNDFTYNFLHQRYTTRLCSFTFSDFSESCRLLGPLIRYQFYRIYRKSNPVVDKLARFAVQEGLLYSFHIWS